MADTGFPRRGSANPKGGGASLLFCQNFLKTAWKYRKLDRGWARTHSFPPLPQIRQWYLFKRNWYTFHWGFRVCNPWTNFFLQFYGVFGNFGNLSGVHLSRKTLDLQLCHSQTKVSNWSVPFYFSVFLSALSMFQTVRGIVRCLLLIPVMKQSAWNIVLLDISCFILSITWPRTRSPDLTVSTFMCFIIGSWLLINNLALIFLSALNWTGIFQFFLSELN